MTRSIKRILVTGATGGLGRNAVNALLEKGLQVRATGRNAAVGQELAILGAEFFQLDLASATPAQLAPLLRDVDAVWHCAALSSPWGALADFVAANLSATQRLFQAAGEQQVQRFVHISTPALYFDYTSRFEVKEDFRPASYVNDYAATKAQAEQAIRSAAAQFPQMQVVILRPRAIFGPYDQVLIPRLSRVLTERSGRLPLPRGGHVTLDFTYVENVVHAMWLATTRPDIPSCTAFNITNQEPALLRDMLQALYRDALGRPFNIVSVPYPLLATVARGMLLASRLSGREPALTPYSVGALSYDMTLDSSKARQLLGYTPLVSLADGIQRTAQWIKRHG
ncbi:NAD-dependent epimerase/dehydratase family protein [Paraherbaspirillum soli]|uniref:NAD-dependent epimerase/dehydratase family protein n=1 Tax=Paraherbaspirillum soli TaxID=631222 RepID=A0ABW0MDM4_9BURK